MHHRRRTAVACLFLALVLLAATDSALADGPARYEVRRGDNLSVIAQRYGTTVSALKRSNGLKSDVIHVGQQLRIDKPYARRSGTIRWQRPCTATGRVLKPFGQYKRKNILMPQTGVEVACPVGSKVTAAADGIVRHVGPLDGFGTLVIVEHGDRYASVLAPIDPARVKVVEGQAVRRGDELGRTAKPDEDGREPYLHIELRRRDKAIAPDRLLK